MAAIEGIGPPGSARVGVRRSAAGFARVHRAVGDDRFAPTP